MQIYDLLKYDGLAHVYQINNFLKNKNNYYGLNYMQMMWTLAAPETL